MEHVLMKRFDDELWIKYDYFVEKFEQLATVTAERDYWERNANEMNAHWKKEIAAVTKERDELKALLEEAVSYTCCESWSPSLTEEINAALAKVGADKTATYEQIKAEFLTRAHGGID